MPCKIIEPISSVSTALGLLGSRDFLTDHPDDAAAMNAAKQLTDRHDVELWDCGRLVARLSPDGEVLSPGLAPSLIFVAPSDSEKNSVAPPVEYGLGIGIDHSTPPAPVESDCQPGLRNWG
jgi:hypothetical protein